MGFEGEGLRGFVKNRKLEAKKERKRLVDLEERKKEVKDLEE